MSCPSRHGRYLVTGGAGGIGRAIVEHLITRGAEVAILDLPGLRTREVAAEFGVEFHELDLAADPEGVDAGSFGPLAGIVHTAAITDPVGFDELTPEEWRAVVRINVEVPLFLTRRLRPSLTAGAGVVMVSSIEAFTVAAPRGSTMPAYSPSKAALDQLIRVLAWELGPDGIRVNGVAPGLIRTPLAQPIIDAAGDWVAFQTPLGRIGEPADIARVVGFLLSDDAGFLTGQTLVADGGLTIGHGPPPA